MAWLDRILVPVDVAEDEHAAFDHAVSLAKTYHAEVVLLHLRTGGIGADPSDRAAERTLDDRVAELRSLGLGARRVSRTLEMPTVTPAEVIVEVAGHERADLVIMATRGREGLSRLLLGSVTEEVIRQGPCPVLAVRRE